jgi:aryl-alcohol dehydrogenase-like predicted oxidoreductase
MRYNLLGNTGLYVSELCLGTMTFGGSEGIWNQMGGLQQQAVNAQLRTAFDAGVNFIDTANVYSMGISETITGQAIRDIGLKRDELVIATKVQGSMGEGPNDRGHSRYHILNQVDASLKRLHVDHIDLYQLHGTDQLTPIEETLGTLNDLVRAGKVRYIGLCNQAAWHIMKGLAYSRHHDLARFESVQAYYTLAGRDLERDIVPLLADQKLGLMVWSPLAGGLLTGKFSRDGKGPEGARRASFDFPIVDRDRAFACIDAMRPIASRHGVSIAQVALAWLLAQSHVTTVIIGARTQEQLADNLASVKLRLTEEDLNALEKVSALPPEYPGWMIEWQGRPRAVRPYKE